MKVIKTNPVLSYPDFLQPFTLSTDVSTSGLAAVLLQQIDGYWHVIAYASCSLVCPEKNYHSTKLKFLALKWAVTEMFHQYLYYSLHFVVYNDNIPPTYVSTGHLNATGQYWVNEPAQFYFTIKYKPGTQNVVADYLSRIEERQENCNEEVSLKEIEAIGEGLSECNQSFACHAMQLPVDDVKLIPSIYMGDPKQLLHEQQADQSIQQVVRYLEAGNRPTCMCRKKR